MGMQLSELSLAELRKMLRETERVVGPDAQSTHILQRLVGKREQRQSRLEKLGHRLEWLEELERYCKTMVFSPLDSQEWGGAMDCIGEMITERYPEG